MGLEPETGVDVSQVLLVEDSPTEALLIQAVLEESDHPCFSVIRAGTIVEAIGHLDSQGIDVVVLDLTLPDAQGLQGFKTLHQRFPELPVVVVTANANKTLALEAIQLGAQDYIVKEQVENMPLGLSLRFAIERQSLENALKHRQQNLETILQATPVGMLLIDKDLVVRMVNHTASSLLGHCESNWVGKRLGEGLGCVHLTGKGSVCGLLTCCTYCILNKICHDVLRTGESVYHVESQITFLREKGAVVPWLDICCSPVNIDGHQHLILALHDISAKMEAEAIKARLMSMVSHELRSPLGAMKEATDIVLDELPGPLNSEQLKILEIVKRNLLRLHRLTTDFLDFQKLKTGKMSFDMQEADLNAMVKEVYQTMRAATQGGAVELVMDLDMSVPPMVFDYDRMEQVLINLINNSLKFTKQGCIRVTTTSQGEAVLITVQDTGCGMPAEEIPNLFEEFQQLSNTGPGGTGLGLSIAKRIILEHQGQIDVVSDLGQGTTIAVHLPVQVAAGI